jgi:hypothetical protein
MWNIKAQITPSNVRNQLFASFQSLLLFGMGCILEFEDRKGGKGKMGMEMEAQVPCISSNF